MHDQELRSSYIRTFKTTVGQDVLENLRLVAHLQVASGADSPTEMAFLAGQRHLLLHILEMLQPPVSAAEVEHQQSYDTPDVLG